jgi:glycosyltransferase involved in cell wall biosynthesis
MKILFLRRQSLGGIATYSDALAGALEKHGCTVKIDNAEKWIPNETGPKPDAKVTPLLKKLSEDFDIVHAFGYRSAWACAAAFKSYSAWVYTAYDMPKTTHQLLIDKVNEAQAGICSSRAVYRALDEAIAIDLVIERPGILPLVQPEISKEEAKGLLGLPADAIAIVALGRQVPERGFDALLEAMELVWPAFGEAHLVLGGSGPEAESLRKAAASCSRPSQVKLTGHVKDIASFLWAADLVVVPSRRAGTSMVALDAMCLGLPVLLRNTGGLPELIDPDISGMLFDNDHTLGDTINEMLGLPLTLQTLGSAARVRVEEHFHLSDHAESIAKLYRSVLE